MKAPALLLYAICWWNVCCAGPQPMPKPEPVAPRYDKTLHLVVTIEQPRPAWTQSAAATIAPLIAPLATALKALLAP